MEFWNRRVGMGLFGKEKDDKNDENYEQIKDDSYNSIKFQDCDKKNNELVRNLLDGSEIDSKLKQNKEIKDKMNGHKKRRFMYIAMDKDGIPLLDRNENPYFATGFEGEEVRWPKEIQGVAEINEDYREELPDNSKRTNKTARENANKEAEKNAKYKLRGKAEIKIKEAKSKLHEKEVSSEVNIQNTNQETPIVEKEVLNRKGSEIEERNSNPCNDEYLDYISTNKQGNETEATYSKLENENIIEESEEKEENLLKVMNSFVSNTIASVENRLNRDLNESTDDILESISKNTNEISEYVVNKTSLLNENIKKYADETTSIVKDKSQKSTEHIIRRLNDATRTLTEIQDKVVSKTSAVDKRVSDLSESVESIEGKLKSLDQLDDISRLLQDKGLVMSMDIPPINADEEDIINLVRYSQRITEQLGYAARDLIRKQIIFRSQEQSNANEQGMMDKKLSLAREEGITEGKKQLINQLISKYEDIDTIKDSVEGHVHAIWVFLQEIGVEIDGDGEYIKGETVNISKEKAERMMAIYSGIKDEGKYRVIRTGLVFAGEIVYKAEFEKIAPVEEKQIPES